MARAIDLYSGIGGWTLGLNLAGVDVVASYEYWQPAIDTHNANFDSVVKKQNIRELELKSLPKNIDLVVGSPPCTTFSYANKGGGGDVADGLKDLNAFLLVVDYLNPTYWAMENVPRVKGILDELIETNTNFQKFKELVKFNEVVTCSQYGVPQKRDRMIAGNFPHKILMEMQDKFCHHTLGDCVNLLKEDVCKDLTYDISLQSTDVDGTENEDFLSAEELRMNREAKTFNPVYNLMAFPDKTNEPSRTITSTCTRVSRESIIIKDGQNFRRLNLRERALAQGFPLNFKFLGNSYSDQLKMIGNAIPPPLTYLIANAMLDKKAESIESIKSQSCNLSPNGTKHINFNPNTKTKRYPSDRTFKFCIPNLRFGSGVRFQLTNKDQGRNIRWEVEFYYGSSKKIIKHTLDSKPIGKLLALGQKKKIETVINRIDKYAKSLDFEQIQSVWNHTSNGTSPFDVIDFLGKQANDLINFIDSIEKTKVTELLFDEIYKNRDSQIKFNVKKMTELSSHFLAGMILGATFNAHIDGNLSDSLTS